MKYCVLLFCLLIPQLALAQPQEAHLAWFTDATIANSTKMETPGDSLPSAAGTAKSGVNLTKAFGITNPLLSQTRGAISFWLKPNWNGNDNKQHKILSIGDTAKNGLLIEKSRVGTLRFVMAGKNGADTKVTAVRSDVSKWKSGDWHHVVVEWRDKDSAALGLAMWIDRVPVVSDVFGGTEFMNPANMSDSKVYIGDLTSNAVMDELIFHSNCDGMSTAYRDYFRTALYTSIQIANAPQKVKSETRAVAGFKKQFGVMATRTVNPANGTKVTEYITCNEGSGSASQWEGIDAKPYIAWTSSDTSKATVDADGLVTGVETTAKPVGITANFRGMSATYPLTVISAEQPDLDVMYVERTPRYRKGASKVWPATGETVTSIVHYGNFGYKSSAPTKIKFELIPDTNRNFKVDPKEVRDPRTIVRTTDVAGLAPGQTNMVEYKWEWPSYPVYVRVTIDPGNTISEICEANNQLCDRNNAKLVHWGYGANDNQFINDWNARTMNLVGSFSDYDWCQANIERMNKLLRDSVLPTTGPNGVADSARVDIFHTYKEYFVDHEAGKDAFFDGGYEEMWDSRMTLSPGNIHEMGHTVLGLPDLYGHSVSVQNLLMKDENGKPYGGTPLYPIVTMREDVGPWSSATWGYPDALGIGYSPLMVHNHLWLDSHLAGWVHKYAGKRKGLPDYADFFGAMVPKENKLQIFDLNDNPLKNARVYMYQCVNTSYWMVTNKYYPNMPKFVATDNGTGIYTIPTRTYGTWDDYDTDATEGSVPSPTPFDRGPKGEVRTGSPHWQAGNMLLLRIVSNGKTEFQTLPMTELNVAFFSGKTASATYAIRTSLTSSAVTPAIDVPAVPDAIKMQNLRPIAVVNNSAAGANTMEINVKKGEKVTLDGSASFDPEGQPLEYRWDSQFGSTTKPVMTLDTSRIDPGDYEVKLFLIDGVRYSEQFTVTMHVK